MRIAQQWFIVIAVSLAVAWGWCLLDLLLLRPDAAPSWFDIGYMFAFAIGHLIAFFASIVTAVYGISALVRSAEARRIGNFCMTAVAVLVGGFVSFVLLHLNNLS